MTLNHDAVRDLAEAYVLGGLSEEERRAVAAHLKTCVACSREVRELMQVAEALGQLVERREPPPHLRARVLEVIGHTAPAAPTAAHGERPRRSVPLWLAASAAVAAVATGIYAASLRHQSSELEAALGDARLRLGSAERELVQLREAAGAGDRARAILVAADVSQVELRGQPPAPNAYGRAYWSRSAGLLFSATNLPPLPPGKVYQLWIVTSTEPVSAGLLVPDGAGRATLAADVPPDGLPEQIALTMEPAGGVAAPTGEVLLSGAV